jgi:hypothetical protein
VLIEAITGIAMLAVLSATLLTFHSAAAGAAARAEARVTATSLARDHMEEHVAIQDGDGTVPAPGSLTVVTSAIAIDAHGCTSQAGVLRGVTVRAEEAGVVLSAPLGPRARTVMPSEALAASASIGLGASATDRAAVGGAGVLGVTITAADGSQTHPAVVDGCVIMDDLAPGRHEVLLVADAEVPLVGPSHRPVDDEPLVLTVLEVPVLRTWDLSAAAVLSVDVETEGARVPDTVSSGGLRWSMRGDDLRDMRRLGESRPVHPGPGVVVVSACLNPDATASSMRLDIPAGGTMMITVPLATITVQGVAAWPDATLFLSRLTECFDGSEIRPSLMWSGGLQDGMRIALPHGEWEGRLQTAEGTRITAPIRFPAGGVAATVSLS